MNNQKNPYKEDIPMRENFQLFLWSRQNQTESVPQGPFDIEIRKMIRWESLPD